MGLLEMIPREFWLDLYRELLKVAPQLIREEREKELRTETERTASMHRRYDEAISRKKRDVQAKARAERKKRKSNKSNT
jgi:hypothetical protein